MSCSYLSKYFSDHLTNVLPPLWDVWVQSVQVGAEAQRNDLEVICVGTQSSRHINVLLSNTCNLDDMVSHVLCSAINVVTDRFTVDWQP